MTTTLCNDIDVTSIQVKVQRTIDLLYVQFGVMHKFLNMLIIIYW